MAVVDTATRPAPTTADLLQAAGDGDLSAWERLVRRYEPVVTATIRSYRLQEADARDAEQRTWLRLLEHHRGVRKPEALGSWLAVTARRECLCILRDARRVVPSTEVEPPPDPDGDPERRVVEADTAGQLLRLVSLLPPRACMLLTALFDDDPPAYAELSRRTGIPVGSIGPTRARALQQLRTLVDGPPSTAPQRLPCRA
jgi:RNA polymerase sigma factor (sigma-70 family)